MLLYHLAKKFRAQIDDYELVETLNDSTDPTQDQSVDMADYSSDVQTIGEDFCLPESIVIDPPETDGDIQDAGKEETTENGNYHIL